MDIRVSPHCDIVAFRELLDSWITEAGPGCSMEIVKVNEVESNLCGKLLAKTATL